MGRPPEHAPGYKNQNSHYYEIKVRCSNCDWHQEVEISKGVKVDQVLQDFECENCGCEGTLEKAK